MFINSNWKNRALAHTEQQAINSNGKNRNRTSYQLARSHRTTKAITPNNKLSIRENRAFAHTEQQAINSNGNQNRAINSNGKPKPPNEQQAINSNGKNQNRASSTEQQAINSNGKKFAHTEQQAINSNGKTKLTAQPLLSIQTEKQNSLCSHRTKRENRAFISLSPNNSSGKTDQQANENQNRALAHTEQQAINSNGKPKSI
ncbi:unnamed protein product [Mytilus edulis]|uniref:Uncharacterized protein n=1 Tax=Mytilus edulis TaxID=6550 RepID=A0A8S3TVL6_MYTED|nr:unnamed protein product [Mytilus edulis]